MMRRLRKRTSLERAAWPAARSTTLTTCRPTSTSPHLLRPKICLFTLIPPRCKLHRRLNITTGIVGHAALMVIITEEGRAGITNDLPSTCSRLLVAFLEATRTQGKLDLPIHWRQFSKPSRCCVTNPLVFIADVTKSMLLTVVVATKTLMMMMTAAPHAHRHLQTATIPTLTSCRRERRTAVSGCPTFPMTASSFTRGHKASCNISSNSSSRNSQSTAGEQILAVSVTA